MTTDAERQTSGTDPSTLCAALPEPSNKSSSSITALRLARTSFSFMPTCFRNSFCSSTAKSNASNSSCRFYTSLILASKHEKILYLGISPFHSQIWKHNSFINKEQLGHTMVPRTNSFLVGCSSSSSCCCEM